LISSIETALVLLLVFGVLVIFHELGHFIAAKLVGIRVEEFAIGFGPKILRLFKRGDTEYTIHPYPLGGFVKLAGMEPGEEDIPDGYQAQPTWKRAVTIFAGPFASFVLAVLVFVGIGVFAGFLDQSNPQNRIGSVFPGTEAQRINLRTGDRVLSINGQKVNDGKQMIELIQTHPGEQVNLEIQRNGNSITKTGTAQWLIQYLGASWSFQKPNTGVVQDMMKTSVADKAGIKPNDELISINGRRITNGKQMLEAIKDNEGKADIVLRRNGKTVNVNVTPTIQHVRFMGIDWLFPGGYVRSVDASAEKTGLKFSDKLVSINGKQITNGAQLENVFRNTKDKQINLVVERGEDTRSIELNPTPQDYASLEASTYEAQGKLGFIPEPGREKMGFTASVSEGLRITWNLAGQLVNTLTSSRIKEDVGGPLMIVKITHQSLQLGPYFIMLLLGGLSMSLAFINLVPIPVLDGGHLAILAIEAIRRKRLTREQMATVQMIGLAIIVMLVIVVFVSDITKIAGGLVPQ
jgi:regulator of sigma E protease